MFCKKCGNAEKTTSVPNTPPTAGAFGGVTPEQMKANTAQGLANQATVETKESKLIPIADIIALVIWLSFSVLIIINNYVIPRTDKGFTESVEKAVGLSGRDWTESEIASYKEYMKEHTRPSISDEAIITLISFFVGLAIPTLLAFLGKKKNSKVMIIIAGIIYFLSGLGIPSSVLCFIAYAKMKKQAVSPLREIK